MTARQAYPGLRAFKRDETDLFFGRESCIDDMVDRLGATRFLAVLGSSGSGKSSLVRTGLLDALEIGLLATANTRWTVATMRPGGTAIANLAGALQRASALGDGGPTELALLESLLRRGPRSVIDWCRTGNLAPRTNLVILVDQFEELFRYADYAGREEAEAFVALLIECAAASDTPIYVVLTMRSEFLGACSLIPGLAERINSGLYLAPRMTREETRDAMTGPAAVCGFGVEPALVNRLLNDLAAFAPWEDNQGGDQLRNLSRRADQLPLMQHVLNRLWLRASAEAKPVVLRLAEYEKLGGLGGAIDAHAAEVRATLPKTAAPLVERIFRALVTGSTVATALRLPQRFADLVTITAAARAEAAAVVEAFRAPGCNFLMPPAEELLTDDTIIDISHESLIRQWSDLSTWLDREARAGATWRRLAATAEAHARGEAELLVGLDLANMVNWWEKETPTETWATRHGGGFAAARDFLARSREAEERQRAEAAKRKRKAKLFYGAIGAVMIGGVAGLSWQNNRLRDSEATLQTSQTMLQAREAGLAEMVTQLRTSEATLQESQTMLQAREAGLAETVTQLARTVDELATAKAVADAARQNAETTLAAAREVLSGVVGTLGDPQHTALLGGEHLIADLLRVIEPRFAQIQAMGGGQGLAEAERDALWQLGRLMRNAEAQEKALPVFERLHATLERLAGQRALSDRELLEHARAATMLAQAHRNLGASVRHANILQRLSSRLPGLEAPLEGLSADHLSAYGWYLAEYQFAVPYSAETQWRLQVRERQLEVARRAARLLGRDWDADAFVAYAASTLADTYRRLNRIDDARRLRAEGIAARQAASIAAPRNLRAVTAHAYELASQANDELAWRQDSAALAAIEQAVELLRGPLLVTRGNAALTEAGAWVFDNYAWILRRLGDTVGATDHSVTAIELIVTQLRADPRNLEVARNAASRLSTLTFHLSQQGNSSRTLERCVTLASDILPIATAQPANRDLQNLAAAVLTCATDAQNALAPQQGNTQASPRPESERLQDLLRAHADYLVAAFRSADRRVEDHYEFHAQMGGVIQFRQRTSERAGDYTEAERFALHLIAGLTPRQPELNYDIYAMGRLSRAHRDIGDYRLRAGDVAGAAHHYGLCADPDAVPYADRECMAKLADMIDQGQHRPTDAGLAATLRARIPHFQLKRFNVPVRAIGNPDAETFPFEIYIPPPRGFEGIDNQIVWLARARGLELASPDVATSFRRLHEIARQNNVSFPDLAVYALGAANQAPAAPAVPPAPPDAYGRILDAVTAANFTRSPRVSTDRAGVAIAGYDTVAFFTDGAARRGSAEHFVIHAGAIWLFASAENAAAFRADPDRYMPQFGGHCAGCIAGGTKTHANPDYWVVVQGRLYLHSGAGLRDGWREQSLSRLPRAQAEWARQGDNAIIPARDTEHAPHLVQRQ